VIVLDNTKNGTLYRFYKQSSSAIFVKYFIDEEYSTYILGVVYTIMMNSKTINVEGMQ